MTTLTLPFPPSTNNLFPSVKDRRVPSVQYKTWREHAGWEIQRQRPLPVKGLCIVSIELQDKQDGKRRDCDNYIKAIVDTLVHYGLIERDDSGILREIKVKWNADIEGARVTIQSFADSIFSRSDEFEKLGDAASRVVNRLRATKDDAA